MIKFAGFPLSAWAFALRTWAGMMLALYVAFWLQLENGYIAAFTVGRPSKRSAEAAAQLGSLVSGSSMVQVGAIHILLG